MRGEPGTGSDREQAIIDSPYRRMYELSQRLTAGEPTTYDAVKAVETHLQRNYAYNERVPTRATR